MMILKLPSFSGNGCAAHKETLFDATNAQHVLGGHFGPDINN